MQIIGADIRIDPDGSRNCVEIIDGEVLDLNDVLLAAKSGNAVVLFNPDGSKKTESGIIIKLPNQKQQQILTYSEVESVLAELAS